MYPFENAPCNKRLHVNIACQSWCNLLTLQGIRIGLENLLQAEQKHICGACVLINFNSHLTIDFHLTIHKIQSIGTHVSTCAVASWLHTMSLRRELAWDRNGGNAGQATTRPDLQDRHRLALEEFVGRRKCYKQLSPSLSRENAVSTMVKFVVYFLNAIAIGRCNASPTCMRTDFFYAHLTDS